MPTPWDLDRERAFRASPPQKLHRYAPEHTLFQLEPVLEILKPDAPDAWIMDLVHVTAASELKKTGSKGKLRFGFGTGESASGLCVDFDTGIATLRYVPVGLGPPSCSDSDTDTPSDLAPTSTRALRSSSPDPDGASAYHTVTATVTPPAAGPVSSSSLRIDTLSLYDLGGHATPPFEERMSPKPRLRTLSPSSSPSSMPLHHHHIRGSATETEETEKEKEEEEETEKKAEAETRVDEEELKKRIRGFGSGS